MELIWEASEPEAALQRMMPEDCSRVGGLRRLSSDSGFGPTRWDHRVRRLLEDKRTRYARREIFRV